MSDRRPENSKTIEVAVELLAEMDEWSKPVRVLYTEDPVPMLALQTVADPRWIELDTGSFALHIHPVGNAVIVDAGPGEGDVAAFRDWLDDVWPQEEDG